MSRSPNRIVAALLVALASALPAAVHAQDQAAAPGEPLDPRVAVLQTEEFVTPPDAILEAVMAATRDDLELDDLDPTGTYFMRVVGDGLPTMAQFAIPRYNLGQFQIDPAANRSRNLTTRGNVGIELYSTGAELVRSIDIPDGARISGAQWSPDGSRIGFMAHFPDATHIYVANPENGDSERVTDDPLLATLVTGFEWTDDGERVVAVILPEDRGPEPEAPQVPTGPQVRNTSPERNSLRIYFDLLEDPYEKDLVHYYTMGQLALIDVGSGDIERIGQPAMIDDVDPSPAGDYFRVTTLKQELSYIVPTMSGVGSMEEIWNTEGEPLALLEEEDLDESVQGQGGRGGGPGGGDDDDGEEEKRGLTWRSDGGPGMVFLQLQSEEEAGDEDPMDRVMYWLPPFNDNSVEVIYESETEIEGVDFDATGRTLFISREDDDVETIHAVSLDDASGP